MPRTTVRIGFLDTLVILALGVTLALLILWAAGHVLGRDLFSAPPSWLSATISSVWGFLTAGGASVLLGALRYLIDRRRPTPNYILWTGATALCFLFAIGSSALLLGLLESRVAGTRPEELDLKFIVAFPERPSSLPNVSYLHKKPVWKGPRVLAPQPAGHYEERIRLPDSGEQYVGEFHRAVLTSELRDDAQARVTRLCFVRAHTQPARDKRHVVLNCREGGGCVVDRDDPGWAEPCDQRTQVPGWIAEAVAQESRAQNSPGWRVPALDTLRSGREGMGYTEFLLETGPLSKLEKATRFTYAVTVNGTPVLIDGWAPEDIRVPFDPEKGVALSFGLENLDFSGAQSGMEAIDGTFEFQGERGSLKRTRVRLMYVALRDAPRQTAKANDGLVFTWRATYIRPRTEHKFEIFVYSNEDMRWAEERKKALDLARLSFEGREVIAVLRPRLEPSRWHGVVLGLRQPSGQIRFTFDGETATRLCRWAWSARSRGPTAEIIDRDAYRYEMEPRAPGAPKFRFCREL
jgi:hypothetical protein